MPGFLTMKCLNFKREESLLLTADKDFGELVFRQRKITVGVNADPISWSDSCTKSTDSC